MNKVSSFDQVCRACLTTCCADFDLLQNPDAAELYIRLSSTKLDSEDPLPTKICSGCHQRLEDIRSFQTTCIESYNSLLSNLLVDINDEKLEMLIKEEQIDIGLSEEVDKQLWLKGENSESESNGGSEYDPLEDEDGSGDVENSSKSSSGDNTEKDAADSNEDEKPLARSKIKRKYIKQKDSGKVDGSNKTNIEIETEPGKKGKLYYCEKCPKTFMKRWTYDGHLRVHMGLKAYACKQCPKTFNYYNRFLIHEKKHSVETVRVLCPIDGCTRDFKNSSTMAQHVHFIHTNPRIPNADRPRFVCEQCGKVLSTKAVLMKHVLSHEKDYSCKLCTSNFMSRRELFRHTRLSHAKFRRHVCTYCDQRFIRKITLRQHVMRHTGETRHECPICGKKFIQKTSFRMHLQRHNKTDETKAADSATHGKADNHATI